MGRTFNTGRTWFKKGAIPWNRGVKRNPEWNIRGNLTRIKNDPRPWHDKEWLFQEYIIQEKTPLKIVTDAGFPGSYKTIRYWIDKHGIRYRTRSESARLRKYELGEKSSQWNGGEVYRSGYLSIYREYKNGQTKYDFAHRLIAEKALGRDLKRSEIVHHINGNEKDNRNRNLLICDNSYHKWLHNEMSRRYAVEHFGG